MLLSLLLAYRADLDVAALDAAFKAAVVASPAPAVAAAIVKDGKTEWTKTHGKGISPDTDFRIASLTKAFTATIVLQLVAEGKIALDDPIGKKLPALPSAWRGVTVRQLLNHTSGIPSYTDQPGFEGLMTKRQTPLEIVARTAALPMEFTSGAKFKYNNTGYTILGILVEKLDGRPFERSLSARITQPLGLKHTRLDRGGKAQSSGYDAKGGPAAAIDMSQPYAAGSIVSTASDMAKWLAAQDSERLLPKRLWEEARKPALLTDGKPTNYGFGWVIGRMNGIPTLEHGGGIPGYSTYVVRVPSKRIAAVVLTNSEGGDPETVAAQILEAAEPSLKASIVAVDDPDPKITETFMAVLRGLTQGEVDKKLLSDALAARLTPETAANLKELLSGFGPLKEVRLVKIEGAARSYVALYEKKRIRANIAVGADGKLTGFGISPN